MANCPHCHAEYTPNLEQEFCDRCGKRLGEAPATLARAPSPPGLGASPEQLPGAVAGALAGAAASVGVGSAQRPPAPAEASAGAPNTGRANVVGEHNIGAGRDVIIRQAVEVEFCASGFERIIHASRTFMCPECRRSPICDRHFDETRRLCTTCIEGRNVACAICGGRLPADKLFTCQRCHRVAGTDHKDAARNMCTECSARWAGVVEAIQRDEVVITAHGTVAEMDNVKLVKGVLQTRDGKPVATIKENIWYAKPKQWHQVKPKLLIREQRAMQRFYPNLALLTSREGDLRWEGPVSTWAGNEYVIQLRYPDAFPYMPPKAYILSPKVERSRHIYEDGHLCLFHRDDKTWQPETTAATVMSWVSLWLHCYEVWQETGEWPRREHDQIVVSPVY